MNARLGALGAGLIAAMLAGLLLHVPGADSVGSTALVRRFVLVLAVAAGLYLLACRLAVLDRAGSGSLALVLGVALLMRVPALVGPPFLSSDLFRYLWDGRVQLAGINPYRYIPADPALAGLRDHLIFDHVNRRFYAPTIYPPAAQLAFRAIAAVSQTPLAVKLADIGWEAVAIACLLATLRIGGLPASRVLLYAWNPLAAWCYAGNGHVDAEAIALMAAALLARASRRDGWAGVAIAGAFLVKFLPAAIAPALWRGRWRLPVAAALTIVLLYLPFLGVGIRHVLGFLGSYGSEEGFSDGQGIWLLAGIGHLVPLSAAVVRAYAALIAVLLGGAALAVALRHDPDAAPAADVARLGFFAGHLAALTLLLLSPHYPWYFPFLAIFAVLRPSRALLWMSVAPLVLYLSPWHEFFVWPALIYVPALVLFLRDERRIMSREIMPTTSERIVS